MESLACATVFWPGIIKDIQSTHNQCVTFNRNAPSPAALPLVLLPVPATLLGSVFADCFEYCQHQYLVAGEQLSGWVKISQATFSTAQAGSNRFEYYSHALVFKRRYQVTKARNSWQQLELSALNDGGYIIGFNLGTFPKQIRSGWIPR